MSNSEQVHTSQVFTNGIKYVLRGETGEGLKYCGLDCGGTIWMYIEQQLNNRIKVIFKKNFFYFPELSIEIKLLEGKSDCSSLILR